MRTPARKLEAAVRRANCRAGLLFIYVRIHKTYQPRRKKIVGCYIDWWGYLRSTLKVYTQDSCICPVLEIPSSLIRYCCALNDPAETVRLTRLPSAAAVDFRSIHTRTILSSPVRVAL